jgi:hypothetical protein
LDDTSRGLIAAIAVTYPSWSIASVSDSACRYELHSRLVLERRRTCAGAARRPDDWNALALSFAGLNGGGAEEHLGLHFVVLRGLN